MSFILDFLLGNPYVPWLVGLLILLYLYRRFAPTLRFKVPGSGMSGGDFLGKILGPGYAKGQLSRQAAKLRKSGQFLAAGKLLEENEQTNEAIEVYIEGGEFWAAAANLEKLNRLDKAAELYLQAGDYKKAAQVYTQSNKPAKAAALFQEKGNNLEAARLYGQGGVWDKAADLYMKSGYPQRAAEAYEKLGDLAKAAQAYEQHFMENVSYATTYSSTATSSDQKSSLHAGRLYEKAGDLQKALNIYMKGSYFKQAAAVCVSLKQYPKAAELFMRAEDPRSAAEAHEKAGDLPAAANLRGEVALKEGQVPQAADFFQQGKDYLRSAELFESVGMLAQAAGAYEAGESWAAAGNVYVRAGLKDKAAQSYERAGDLETAARLYEEAGMGGRAIPLYEKAGFTFKSGESAARSGDRAKAIALLQRVPANDENYGPATELLARMFIEEGKPGLAVERVQKVLGGQPVAPTTIDLYYWLAVGLETAGKNPEALAIFRKVQSENLHYQDVARRVARLEEGGTVPPLPPPPLLGAESPLASPQPTSAPPAAGSPAAAPRPAEAPGGRTPRFSPKEEIGRGPLGVVYRGEDSVDGRSVALRWIRPDLLGADGLGRMGADLKAAAAVSHPNLVKILGLVDLQGQRYVVTEHVAGRSFAEALAGGHKMSVKQVHSLGRVLAQVLALVHGKGLVHGSIQPSNLMVAGGVVKLADLGLGRLAHAHGPQPGYRAPENKLDVSGDLYALSGVLYHLLTGVHPRSQPQGAALPMPSTLAPGVPEALDKLLLRNLHPRPELRHASA
ncbi:MAG TPA: protein kinase, partial [Vicinamibacteria bacterium]|nr:protein kinase [Vicinamibacteria bacterium]